MGPFEEEEEVTGIASDIVKVEGAESGHPRSPDLRNDTGAAISPISGQQNKATHTLKNALKASGTLPNKVYQDQRSHTRCWARSDGSVAKRVRHSSHLCGKRILGLYNPPKDGAQGG